MARLPMHGSVIVPDWHETVEGKEYLACILRKNRRREFANSANRARNMETAHPCQQQLSPEMLLTESSLRVMPSAGHFAQQPCNRVSLCIQYSLLCIQYLLCRPG
ncbi:similar to novel protein (predicted), isoform CRA_a [Rattus norvegicus]|uniref:Ciliogenesis and planar polarity effector 2-like n=2 Tax=Rattus norvegicus TaxID=10116 RepID=D3ZJQ5_RAT|nr:ciliogenesis and planar polarity effector 2 [Rattus norvegicus]EDL80972.1 similar to novel protein (predicted), isoform CRA_a [Rattus norvegicus]|eukprot:NP_001102742.1 REM2- and Rab-like small GTPase 1 [Rattus norvegicus]